jgi:hypothetical protein
MVHHISQKDAPKAEQLLDDELDCVGNIALENPSHHLRGDLELVGIPYNSQA